MLAIVCNSINSLQNELLFDFPVCPELCRVRGLHVETAKVERERSVKNWGKYTFTSCAFTRRCDPGPFYPIMRTPVDWSRLRIKGNSLFCSFELPHKQLTLGTLLRTALAWKGFNWPFFFVLVNLASEQALHFEWKERGAARERELRGVPLARDFPRYPPRRQCAHRLWRIYHNGSCLEDWSFLSWWI